MHNCNMEYTNHTNTFNLENNNFTYHNALYYISVCGAKFVREIVKKNKFPIKGSFDKKFGTSFDIDGRKFDLEQFGRLELVKRHTEKFLKGNFIVNGKNFSSLVYL